MKKFLKLFSISLVVILALFATNVNAQVVVTPQTTTATYWGNGYDGGANANGAFISVAIPAPALPADAVSGCCATYYRVSSVNVTVSMHYASQTGSTGWCPSWYEMSGYSYGGACGGNFAFNGTSTAINSPQGCAPQSTTLPVLGGFPYTYSGYINDNDNFNDNVYVEVKVVYNYNKIDFLVPAAITCPGDFTVTLDPGACCWPVSYDARGTSCGGNFDSVGIKPNFGPIPGILGAYDASLAPEFDPNGVWAYPGLVNGPESYIIAQQYGYTPPDGQTLSSAFEFNTPTSFKMYTRTRFANDPNYYDLNCPTHGGDGALFNITVYNFKADAEGTISFKWDFAADDPYWEEFNVDFNGVTDYVSDWNGAQTQSGTYTMAVAPGDEISLWMNGWWDDDCGANTNISNFVFTPVPVPLNGLYVVSGPAPGEEVCNGETKTVTLGVYNSDALLTTCSFDIHVNAYPNPTHTLVCNDQVQVSVDADCHAYIGADMILEGGPYGCYDDYNVEVFTSMPANVAGAHGNVSQPVPVGNYWVGVYEPSTGNNCWSYVNVMDKMPPAIECGNALTVDCYVATPVVQPTVTDNCNNWVLSYVDDVDEFYCSTNSQVISRTWTVTDKNNGMKASCVQTINKTRATLADLAWPVNFDGVGEPMLECDGTYPLDKFGNPAPYGIDLNGKIFVPGGTYGPDGIGYNGTETGACGTIEIFYKDDVYNLACGKKILRHWTVVDDCTGTIETHTQIIRITDTTDPTFCTPENINARAKAYVCEQDIKVPAINCLKDNCDANPKWWVTTNAGVLVGDKDLDGYVDANETWWVLGVPMGTYDLCYHAIDNCGNQTDYCAKITVLDGVPPIPVCEQYKQVSLSGYGNAMVEARSYDSGSFDNCSDVWFKVLRVNANLEYDGGCPDLNGDDNLSNNVPVFKNDVWFDDEVFFCCEDLDKDIMVTLRVFDINPGVGPINPTRMLPGGDLYGHFNDCWNVTHIECKIPPVLTCKPVTVSCEESLDPKDNPRLRIDVVALCDVQTSYADARDNKVCGANITRTWTAVGCGKTTTCKQAITVVGSTPFDPCTIEFPTDKQVHCTKELPAGGEPTWKEYPCNVITAEYVDDTFHFVDGSCYKILREWHVIDWCVFVPNTGAEDNVDAVGSNRKFNCNTLRVDGYYKYTQVLKVVDLIPPTITVNEPCIPTTDCNAYFVTLNATAADTCNTNQEFWWKYKVENLDCICDPVQVSYNYVPKPVGVRVGKVGVIAGVEYDVLDKVKTAKLVLWDPAGLPQGHYKVTWTVGDGCGNATTKEQFFTIADKKAPTPYMVDIATAVMENGMVAMRARMFDKGGCADGCISSVDNCTPKEGLYFTFTPYIPTLWADPNPNTTVNEWEKQYADFGFNVFDPNTGAYVSDPDGSKFNNGTAHRWHRTSRTSERAWNCTYVAESNYSKTVQVYVWDKFAYNEDCDNNNYDFANVIVNFNHCETDPQPLVSGNVQINTMKVEAKYNEGTFTTTSDMLGDYTLGVNANNEYKVSGTKDVDWLNGVTTLDLVIIQKFLVGLKSITDPKLLLAADINNNGEIAASDLLEARKVILGTKERFTNNSWIAVDPVTNKREKVLNVAEANISGVNFVAVKIGDMNASALGNRNAASVRFMTDDAVVNAGELVEVPFYAENFDGIYGAQFTMNLGGMSLENVKAGAITLDESNYNVVNGNLIVSFNEAKGLNVADGNVLFTVELKANVDGKLSNLLSINDQVLKSEIYAGKDLDINSIEIGYRNADVNYALYQNEPNPFVGKTTIGFELPTDANYTLTVYDVTGKELKVINSRGVAGYNSVAIDGINTTGVMTYRLQSDDFTATKKMVSIK